MTSGAALAATFGTVVPIGGQASDLALDESRSQVYVANYTASRIDVVSTKTGLLVKNASMSVAKQPSGLSLSPNGRYLVVTHLSNFATAANGLTIIDLTTNKKQTFAFGSAPMGVAFCYDGTALVVTTTDFLILDPATGTTKTIGTINTVITPKLLPVAKPPVGPSAIIRASVTPSGDLGTVWGVMEAEGTENEELIFRYDAHSKSVKVAVWTSTPILGPRSISTNKTGSLAMVGWALYHQQGFMQAQFPDALGNFGIGGHVFDTDANTIYAQVPDSTWKKSTAPVLQVVDADNLAVRDKLQLKENLSGRALLSSDKSTIYAISVSGISILPVGSLKSMPRLQAQQEDLVFRGQWCDRKVMVQKLNIVDPGGNKTDFTLTPSTEAIKVSPSSGTTPAEVEVSVDISGYLDNMGTTAGTIDIKSAAGVNLPSSVRVLVNNREPDQRGTFLNIPGKLVSLLADPYRKRFYVLRQDKNQVLVYDAATYTLITTLRTGNTPWSMTITPNGKYLITGADNSQVAHSFDLDTLKPYRMIVLPFGHYPRWVAASRNAILAASRVAGPKHTVDQLRVIEGTSVTLPSLGVWENDIDVDTALAASPSGASIMMAQANGTAMLYDANTDTFIAAATPADAFSGAIAALADDTFVADNYLFNASLGVDQTFENASGKSSGFAVINGVGLRTTAPNSTSAGTIARVDFEEGTLIHPTRMTEAPVLPVANSGSAFTRSLAVLADGSAILSLSTSGVTVLSPNYDEAVASPRITGIVSAADMKSGVAPGGLFSITGTDLSPTNVATSEIPLPTALGDSCMTINGELVPMVFVSPSQINGQVPFGVAGDATLILHTPAGVSNDFGFTVAQTAPSVFLSKIDGWSSPMAVVVRAKNSLVATPSNPIHLNDWVTIYLTGMGAVSPEVKSGYPGPSGDLAKVDAAPTVTLGGTNLNVAFAGLAPGQVGVYQINVQVPFKNVKTGMSVPLVIRQGDASTTVNVRVVN